MRLRRIFNRYSMKQKMMISFISLSLIAVLLMNFLSNVYYGRATQNDFYNITEGATVSINHQLDLYFRQMAQSTHTMIAGPLRYTSPLADNDDSGLIQDWLRGQVTSLDKQAVIKDILSKYISFNYPEIDNIYLMSMDKRILETYGRLSAASYEALPWFNLPFQNELQILPTHYQNNSPNPLVSLIIPIYDVDTIKMSGRLIINLRLNQIREIIGKLRVGTTGYMFIVSNDDKLVYHPQTEWLSYPLEDTGLEGLSLADSRSMQEWNDERYLLSYSQSELTGWKTAAVVPFHEMAAGLQVARNSAIIVLLLLVLLIVIAVPILSGILVRPIIQLKEAMEKLQVGNLSVRAPVEPGRDEIQLLGKSFNRMTERLDELVNTVTSMELKEVQMQLMQKEATIQALQNQINPHLLYNTLDIIKSIAYLEEVPKIERMAENLASLYRYTAKLEHAEVSLGDELEHLAKYLDIIHVRYTKRFESKLYVHAKYRHVPIVKLSLQPIVENAVKYAVEPRNGKATVIVNAYPDREDLVIEIADNGQGIEEAKLKSIQDSLDAITKQTHQTAASGDSLGLANVHSRLVLMYGKKYGLQLHSFSGKGTVVSIRIPFSDKNSK